MSAISQAAQRIKVWREHPIAFVREVFGVEPDAWQAEALEAFPHQQRIAMKACKGPGKTAFLAWIAWNFLATRPHPKIAATSITSDNLDDGLWTEMAKWQARSPFLQVAFQWGKTRIVARDHPETWWMSARTWSKTADATQQADTLAGLHADYLMFLLDESGGIPDAVMAAAEAGLATGIECKLVQAGNPTALSGPLYRACTSERHLWKLIEITGDPDDPKRSPRISVQWAREQIEKYGRDNPWVLVNVFGRFPPASFNALIGPDEVSAAMGRSPARGAYEHASKVLGVDVARYGDDRTVLFPRQGLAAYKPVIMQGANTMQVAGRIMQAIERWKPDAIFVDGSGGYGAGVIDVLRSAGQSVVEVQFGGKPIDPRFRNKRTEMWWLMAEWVKGGGCLPPNAHELGRELTAPEYAYSGDRFELEHKEQIKERIGVSPDLADALALTFAFPVQPAMRQHGSHGKTAHEYNPTEDRHVLQHA